MHWPSFEYYEPRSAVRTYLNLLRFAVLMAMFRTRGLRLFWIAHNLYPHDGGRELLAHRIGRRVVIALSSWVGIHSEAAGLRVQREFGVSQRRLVRLERGNWVSLYPNDISREEARRKLQVAPNAFVFLFFGLCKEYKNLTELVRCHQELADGSLLWIVGKFQSEAYYKEVTAATAGSQMVWVRNGRIEHEDVQIYFKACDVVVLPYKEILSSGTVYSALGFGRPVVAPRLSDLEEVVTSACGVLYEPNQASALTGSLRAVRERTFDSAQILQHALQFSWERGARHFLDAVDRDSR
jgi:glycosyltransferase involved in cell wall biosynthesis